MHTVARVLCAVTALVTVVVAAGCAASGPDATPSGKPTAPAPAPTTAPVSSAAPDDIDAAITGQGSVLAIVTPGATPCAPDVTDAVADGQVVTVTLVDDAGCPGGAEQNRRVSVSGMPAGVDPTQPVTLRVNYAAVSKEMQVEGNSSFGAEPHFGDSAVWMADDALALVTWGSSSSAPLVDTAVATGQSGSVYLSYGNGDADCNSDLVARGTWVQFEPDQVEEHEGFTLTIDGVDRANAVRIPVLCCAVLCCAVLCCAVLCCAVLS